jgi:hypothetical protein
MIKKGSEMFKTYFEPVRKDSAMVRAGKERMKTDRCTG